MSHVKVSFDIEYRNVDALGTLRILRLFVYWVLK